jgi:hypothetical protein
MNAGFAGSSSARGMDICSLRVFLFRCGVTGLDDALVGSQFKKFYRICIGS